MRTTVKLAITALVAAASLAALVGSASANRLSITNRNIRVTWSSLEFSGAGRTVRCEVTLEGSFHNNTIAKVERSLIGYVTAIRVKRPCTGGTAWAYNGTEVNELLGGTFPNSLPWHITYEGFNGSLPTPAAVRILLSNAKFLIRSTFFGIGVLCVYTTGANGNATGTANLGAGGRVESLGAGGSISSESGGACPVGSFLSPGGDGRVTLLGNTNAISVTLI